ncbi:MAG: hypothetical protein SGI74_09920 [Oligoflexia bacterium]|nr:hypothetical protein [Oligoflexia bacterium]
MYHYEIFQIFRIFKKVKPLTAVVWIVLFLATNLAVLPATTFAVEVKSDATCIKVEKDLEALFQNPKNDNQLYVDNYKDPKRTSVQSEVVTTRTTNNIPTIKKKGTDDYTYLHQNLVLREMRKNNILTKQDMLIYSDYKTLRLSLKTKPHGKMDEKLTRALDKVYDQAGKDWLEYMKLKRPDLLDELLKAGFVDPTRPQDLPGKLFRGAFGENSASPEEVALAVRAARYFDKDGIINIGLVTEDLLKLRAEVFERRIALSQKFGKTALFTNRGSTGTLTSDVFAILRKTQDKKEIEKQLNALLNGKQVLSSQDIDDIMMYNRQVDVFSPTIDPQVERADFNFDSTVDVTSADCGGLGGFNQQCTAEALAQVGKYGSLKDTTFVVQKGIKKADEYLTRFETELKKQYARAKGSESRSFSKINADVVKGGDDFHLKTPIREKLTMDQKKNFVRGLGRPTDNTLRPGNFRITFGAQNRAEVSVLESVEKKIRDKLLVPPGRNSKDFIIAVNVKHTPEGSFLEFFVGGEKIPARFKQEIENSAQQILKESEFSTYKLAPHTADSSPVWLAPPLPKKQIRNISSHPSN